VKDILAIMVNPFFSSRKGKQDKIPSSMESFMGGALVINPARFLGPKTELPLSIAEELKSQSLLLETLPSPCIPIYYLLSPYKNPLGSGSG